MLNKYIKNKVLLSKSFEELNNYFLKSNFKYKESVIDYCWIVKDLDKMYSFLKEAYATEKNSKNILILDYYQYLYFVKQNDSYNAEKLRIKLIREKYHNSEWIINISNCKTLDEQLKIFDSDIAPILSNLKLLKEYTNKYSNIIIILYLINFNRVKETIFDDNINRFLIKKIRKELKEKNTNVKSLLFFRQLIGLYINQFPIHTDFEKYNIIGIEMLKKIIYKTKENITYYKDVLNKDELVEYNEIIITGLRHLLTNAVDDNELEKIDKEITDFIKNNDVKPYTKFIFDVIDERKKGNFQIDEKLFVNMIKEILNGNTNGDILHTIFLQASTYSNDKQFEGFAKKIKKIKYNSSTIADYDKDSLTLGIKLLDFWAGENIKLDFKNDNMYISPFLEIVINYENREINYEDFKQQLNSLNSIDYYSIFNWNRLDTVFKNNNDWEWLILLFKKLDTTHGVDYKIINFLNSIYVSIINNECTKVIGLEKFKTLNSIIFEKIENNTLRYYALLCYLTAYNSFDKDVKSLINDVLDNFDDIASKISKNEWLNLIYSIMIFMFNNNDDFFKDKMLKILNKYIATDDLLLYKYCLSIFDDSIISDCYEKIVGYVYKFYCDINNIPSDVFRFLVLVANKVLIEKTKINAYANDIVYNDNDGKNLLVLNNDYTDTYKDIYSKLGFKKVKTVPSKAIKDCLLHIITCKIYFANMEKYKIGQGFTIPENLKGKDLLLNILDKLGYSEKQTEISNIRNGQIINTFWLNQYNIHQLFKDTKSLNDMRYSNSMNKLLDNNDRVIHITTLLLLAKLNLLDCIKKDKSCFITSYEYNDIMKIKSLGIFDFIDGVIEEKICYDDLVNQISDLLEEMFNDNRVIEVSSANVPGFKNLNNMNDYDKDIFKIIISKAETGKIINIITEDTFYLKQPFFEKISSGTFGLLVKQYSLGNISGKKVLEITEEFEKNHYNLSIEGSLYEFLVNKSDDKDIEKVVKIINKYK